jgi:hypothetical protein
MLANKSISLIQNFISGVSRYIEHKKKRETEITPSEITAKPVKYDKIRILVKKRGGSDSDSDSDSDYDKVLDKRDKNKLESRGRVSNKNTISKNIYETENKYGSDHEQSNQMLKLKKKKKHDKNKKKHRIHKSDINDINRNDALYNSDDYYRFLEFKRLQLNENPNNSNVNSNVIRTPQLLVVPTKSEEQVKLDGIQLQLDNLMPTDIDSLTSIMTIEYFDRVLEILNSIKQNINTEDETIRNRLIMILHLIFSFITTNRTNVNLKKNITEITNKYNNLVDKLYPNKNFIQPLSREIKLNLKLDPVYDLYVQRYGLPKGNLFDNSKINLLKAEMQWT